MPEYFETLWRLVTAALEPGGVFVGHLFGERHGWAALAHMTFQTEAQARLLCGNLELHLLREFEQPGASLQGTSPGTASISLPASRKATINTVLNKGACDEGKLRLRCRWL